MSKISQGVLGTFRGLQLFLLNSLAEPLSTGVQPLHGGVPTGRSGEHQRGRKR